MPSYEQSRQYEQQPPNDPAETGEPEGEIDPPADPNDSGTSGDGGA